MRLVRTGEGWRARRGRGGGGDRRQGLGAAPSATTSVELPQELPSLSPASRRRGRRGRASGFTLTEVLLVVAIIGLLSAIAIPNMMRALADTRIKRAMVDIRAIETQVAMYEVDQGHLPDTLADLGLASMTDPWGRPYQYLRIEGRGKADRGKWRMDRFLVPLNSDYDLYSMGPDGLSRPPLTAAASRDDIIRAGNGSFVGVATDY